MVQRGAIAVYGDVLEPETLQGALSGIDLVISALSGAGLAGEITLAKASKEQGVKRFVPSHFGVNLANLELSEIPGHDDPAVAPLLAAMVTPKLEIIKFLKLVNLDYVQVSTNIWIEIAFESAFACGFDAIEGDTVKIPSDGREYALASSLSQFAA